MNNGNWIQGADPTFSIGRITRLNGKTPKRKEMISSAPTENSTAKCARTKKLLPWYDSRTYNARPHESLSAKLREPYTKAHPLRSSPTRVLSMLIAVTCNYNNKITN
jgi:hypothetical protein